MTPRTLPVLTAREMSTAVLSLIGDGSADPGDRHGAWLIDQLSRAAKRSLHLASAVRELQAAFPRLTDPMAVVDRLLACPSAHVTLAWNQSDETRVYLGFPAQEPVLPRGQNHWLPGFDMNDWTWGHRPRRPLPAGAA